MRHYLVIDGGQTGCRAVLFDGETEAGRGFGPGYSHYAPEGALEAMLRSFEQALAALPDQPVNVTATCLGLTGFSGLDEDAKAINYRIRQSVNTGPLILTNDSVTAYIGALGFQPGVVAAAGTGVIVLAADENGNHARSDGWGYILGDSGSGFAIGRDGLASALRALDGRCGSSALLQRVLERYGSHEQLRRHIYRSENPVSTVAEFAADVAAAARAGDPAAASIWANAVKEIAHTTLAAARQLFEEGQSLAVSWTGGLFHATDLLLTPFMQDVQQQWLTARLTPPVGTQLDGARRLVSVTESPPVFGQLIHVFHE